MSTEGLHRARPAADISFWGVWQIGNCVAEIHFSSVTLGRQGERDKHTEAGETHGDTEGVDAEAV